VWGRVANMPDRVIECRVPRMAPNGSVLAVHLDILHFRREHGRLIVPSVSLPQGVSAFRRNATTRKRRLCGAHSESREWLSWGFS
jgi:hypothetical protein